jgi:hypothetical protein
MKRLFYLHSAYDAFFFQNDTTETTTPEASASL